MFAGVGEWRARRREKAQTRELIKLVSIEAGVSYEDATKRHRAFLRHGWAAYDAAFTAPCLVVATPRVPRLSSRQPRTRRLRAATGASGSRGDPPAPEGDLSQPDASPQAGAGSDLDSGTGGAS